MSTATSIAGSLAPSPRERRERDAPARRLRAVEAPAPRRRPRIVYALIALVGAVLIGGVQMTLSILTTQGSYDLSALTQQQREVTWQKQILTDSVTGLSSPQYLAANASALGMVINESPSYLRLSDGALLGAGQAAAGASSVDALGRANVPNNLIAQTPLVTAPAATIQGPPAPSPSAAAGVTGATGAAGASNTPPPLTVGLPAPATH